MTNVLSSKLEKYDQKRRSRRRKKKKSKKNRRRSEEEVEKEEKKEEADDDEFRNTGEGTKGGGGDVCGFSTGVSGFQ